MRKLSLIFLVLACDPMGMTACLDLCDDQKVSETDRATCRVSCESGYRGDSSPAFDPGVGQATRCLGTCYPPKSGTVEPACVAACHVGAEGHLSAEVLETLEACVAGCQADARLDEDDRATCRLMCAQSAGR